VLAKGAPRGDTFEALDGLAEAIAQANFSDARDKEAAPLA